MRTNFAFCPQQRAPTAQCQTGPRNCLTGKACSCLPHARNSQRLFQSVTNVVRAPVPSLSVRSAVSVPRCVLLLTSLSSALQRRVPESIGSRMTLSFWSVKPCRSENLCCKPDELSLCAACRVPSLPDGQRAGPTLRLGLIALSAHVVSQSSASLKLSPFVFWNDCSMLRDALRLTGVIVSLPRHKRRLSRTMLPVSNNSCPNSVHTKPEGARGCA